MRSSKKSCISPASFLLLLCALQGAPRMAAQKSCTITFTCPTAGGGCASAMGDAVTKRGPFTQFASTADCNTKARSANSNIPGVGVSCSCVPPDGTSAADSATAAPAAPGHEFDNTIKQAISAGVAGKLPAGNTIGFVGIGLLGNALLAPITTNPAEQQQQQEQQQLDLAAQQLNNSGIYLLRHGNATGAINEFQQALVKTPNDANILQNLKTAQQKLKDNAVAGQTSGALGQLLGTAPAGLANSDTALNLVNVNSNPNAVDSTGTTRTSPEALKGELDGVFESDAPTSTPSNAQPVQARAQAQDIDQLFQPSPSNPSQPAPSPSQTNAEQRQVEDLFRGPGATTDSAALQQQAGLGQMSAAAKSDEEASGLARQGFDTAAPNVVVNQTSATQVPGTAVTAAPAPVSSGAIDLSQSKQPLVPANLKTPQVAVNAAPQPAEFPVTVLRSGGSGGVAAPGAPIFDCAGDRALVNRFAAGLPAQEEAIQRTEAAMAAATKDTEDARPEAMWAAFKTLNTAAISISELSKSALAQVEGPKSHGITVEAAAQFRLWQDIKDLGELGDMLAEATEVKGKTVDSFKAGAAFGNTMYVQKTARSTADKLKAIQKLLVDSGIRDEGLEEIAGHLALYGLGPIGGPIGDALVHTLADGAELVEKAGEYWNSAGEAEEAERNLTVMRYQQMQVRDRIYELQQEVAGGCPN
jgi:tetratricopeptide (TPR) repeat protein